MPMDLPEISFCWFNSNCILTSQSAETLHLVVTITQILDLGTDVFLHHWDLFFMEHKQTNKKISPLYTFNTNLLSKRNCMMLYWREGCSDKQLTSSKGQNSTALWVNMILILSLDSNFLDMPQCALSHTQSMKESGEKIFVLYHERRVTTRAIITLLPSHKLLNKNFTLITVLLEGTGPHWIT